MANSFPITKALYLIGSCHLCFHTLPLLFTTTSFPPCTGSMTFRLILIWTSMIDSTSDYHGEGPLLACSMGKIPAGEAHTGFAWLDGQMNGMGQPPCCSQRHRETSG